MAQYGIFIVGAYLTSASVMVVILLTSITSLRKAKAHLNKLQTTTEK